MFGSDTSRNSGFLVSNPSSLKHARDSMGSDLFLFLNQTQLQQQQGGGGLARFRSAPSSFLAALLDSTADHNSSSGDESEALFSAFMDQKRSNGENLYQYHMKQENENPEPRPGPGPGTQMGYESGSGCYSVNGSGNSSHLVRQSSSPAGFFNGYGMMGIHNNHHSKGGISSSSAAKNFSSGSSSTSRFMPSIPENANDSNVQLGRASSANAREFEAVFPRHSWTDTTFNNLKRSRDDDDDDAKMFPTFNGLENQNGETRKNHHGLVHHLSLPKTSSEMAEVEKFLQFQPETVPCQIRAKRGCATHPRSIAERIRRTRISEKMKKLQDLFPNMDKQTSTADMLDLAVEFIKDLQKQVDTLTETKARCVCSNKPQQVSPNS